MSKASNLAQPPTYYNPRARTTRLQHAQQSLYQPQPMPRIPPSYNSYTAAPNAHRHNPNPLPINTNASATTNNSVPPPILPFGAVNTLPMRTHPSQHHLYNTTNINTGVAPLLSSSSVHSDNKSCNTLTRTDSSQSIGSLEQSDQSIMAIIRDHPTTFDQTTAKTYSQYRNKNGINPRNPAVNHMKLNHISTKRKTNQQIIQNMIPNIPPLKPKEAIKREMKHKEKKIETNNKNRIDISRLNVAAQVSHDANAVYNGVCIEDLLNQIKTAMDKDPKPEVVKYENYIDLIQRYFRCELSKYGLDWFMREYYRRYIKLHNAMFKYIRWNAMLQSTKADTYGLGGLTANMIPHTQQVDNYPRLHCTQSQEKKLFRGPPHKKRKLNMPKQIQLVYGETHPMKQIKNVAKKKQIRTKRDHIEHFDETMTQLQHENPKLFDDVMQTNADDQDIIKIEKSSIKDNLPLITLSAQQDKSSVNMNINDNKTTNNRRQRRPMVNHKKANHRAIPLQLEVKGIDDESLKANHITKLYHHNEYTNTIQYIAGTETNINRHIQDLDAIQFEKQLKERNISSTNCCVKDVSKPLPCDAMYLSKQHIMSICNGLIRRRNFLNNGEKQREMISIKENYEREWRRDQHTINTDQERKNDFIAAFNADVVHVKEQLHNSLLQPIQDGSIIEVLMEQGLKPMLASLHCKAIQYKKQQQMKGREHDTQTNKKDKSAKREMEDSDHSDTDSDDDIPIIERLKNDKEPKVDDARTMQLRIHRQNNISTQLKKRLSIAPHAMIMTGEDKPRKKENKGKNNEENERKNHEDEMDQAIAHAFALDIRNPVPMESERRLQLKAMLDIEAVDEEESNECWIHGLNKAYAVDGMADVPHVHQCEVSGIHECLLSDQGNAVPNREEIQRSNAEWKKQFEFEVHNLIHMKHMTQLSRDTSSDEPIIQANNTNTSAVNGNHLLANMDKTSTHNKLRNAKRNMDLNINGYNGQSAYYGSASGHASTNTIYPRNYDPKQCISPHHPSSRYGLYHHSSSSHPKYSQTPYHHSTNPNSPRRRIAGKGRKGRKGRSGKGVSGKSLSRNTTIGAKRRGITPNTIRNTRYSSQYTSPNTGTRGHGSGSRSMVWSNHRSPQPSAAYRQRMQSQRMYSSRAQNVNHIASSSHRMVNGSQRLQRYNANYQRLRNNNNINNSNTNTNNSNNNSNSPFPSHYSHSQYNSSQRR